MSIEEPKPVVESKEEEKIVTTAEVEEQPLPQVTADASSTQPEKTEQVS